MVVEFKDPQQGGNECVGISVVGMALERGEGVYKPLMPHTHV